MQNRTSLSFVEYLSTLDAAIRSSADIYPVDITHTDADDLNFVIKVFIQRYQILEFQ